MSVTATLDPVKYLTNCSIVDATLEGTDPLSARRVNGEMMRRKLVLLVGFGIGYVLGARAGRERYEQIKRAASRFWNDPRVSHQVQNVEKFAKDKAPDVVDFIGDTAKKVIQRTPAKSSASSTSSAKSGGAKSGSAKSSGTKSGGTKPKTASTSASSKGSSTTKPTSSTAKK